MNEQELLIRIPYQNREAEPFLAGLEVRRSNLIQNVGRIENESAKSTKVDATEEQILIYFKFGPSAGSLGCKIAGSFV
jgi:hypothetical protein